MSKTALEAQLEGITREFVRRIVDTLRNASFADVAAIHIPTADAPRETERRAPRVTAPKEESPRAGRTRQTAGKRAEIGDRVLAVLERASSPLGLGALARQLALPTAALAAPLRELRTAGRIVKHGERRTTTYSAA